MGRPRIVDDETILSAMPGTASSLARVLRRDRTGIMYRLRLLQEAGLAGPVGREKFGRVIWDRR